MSTRNATSAAVKVQKNLNPVSGILTPMRDVIRLTFGSLFFPSVNLGREAERTLSVWAGYSDKGADRWKEGDKGLISLFRSILANGFDCEKGTFGVREITPEDDLNSYFAPRKDRTPKAIGRMGETIESLTISDDTYSSIVRDCQPTCPTHVVTGGYHRYQILITLVALGILTVEQVKSMVVRCIVSAAETDNIRQAVVKTNPFEILKAAWVILSENALEKRLYDPANGLDALCTSKGNAGAYYLCFLLGQKTEKSCEEISAILKQGKRQPSQDLRKEILAIIKPDRKAVSTVLTTDMAREILAVLGTPPVATEQVKLDSFPDDSVRHQLSRAFLGKNWKSINSFFKEFRAEIEKLKFNFAETETEETETEETA